MVQEFSIGEVKSIFQKQLMEVVDYIGWELRENSIGNIMAGLVDLAGVTSIHDVALSLESYGNWIKISSDLLQIAFMIMGFCNMVFQCVCVCVRTQRMRARRVR